MRKKLVLLAAKCEILYLYISSMQVFGYIFLLFCKKRCKMLLNVGNNGNVNCRIAEVSFGHIFEAL